MTSEANETQSTSATSSHDAIADDIFCQHCGYNLKTLTGDRCPECGKSIAGVRALNSQIPWVYRKELGWWRAYWKTVWLVMFRRRRLAEEMARPVSYRDAQIFRFGTIAIVCIAAILASLSFLATHAQCPTDEPIVSFFWQHGIASAGLHVLGVLFLLAATGLPSYFFHPRAVSVKQQNRAVALSYYACAPLVMSPISIFLLVVPLLFDTKILLEMFFQFASVVLALVLIVLWTTSVRLRSTSDGGKRTLRRTLAQSLATCLLLPWVLLWIVASDRVFVWAAGGLVILAAILLWWVQLIFLARRTMPQCRRRTVWVTLFVPLLWLLSGLLIFVALPAACFFVWIVVASLM
ncbi:MAG: zinc ribbon domain-containing protein [Planctomycetes bacterium]|nr:zinc ribbon domain-containing protein [Planctomycetota bacterium]MBI3835137.1 zinc ribbon domain-containing protein [Planctomycetota bacterium]